jgi:hypothetical protein
MSLFFTCLMFSPICKCNILLVSKLQSKQKRKEVLCAIQILQQAKASDTTNNCCIFYLWFPRTSTTETYTFKHQTLHNEAWVILVKYLYQVRITTGYAMVLVRNASIRIHFYLVDLGMMNT